MEGGGIHLSVKVSVVFVVSLAFVLVYKCWFNMDRAYFSAIQMYRPTAVKVIKGYF